MNLWFKFCTFLSLVNALDNGLAKIPPMGWSSKKALGCNISQEAILK